MKSRMGCTKLHALLHEKWEMVFQRQQSVQKWSEYIEEMGFRTTRITYAYETTPEGRPSYVMQFPDHNDVFFVLDPLTRLHWVSIPQELALKVMILGGFP
jgi:hypothetical protein